MLPRGIFHCSLSLLGIVYICVTVVGSSGWLVFIKFALRRAGQPGNPWEGKITPNQPLAANVSYAAQKLCQYAREDAMLSHARATMVTNQRYYIGCFLYRIGCEVQGSVL